MMKRVSLCLAAALWTFTWLPLALSQKTAADSPDVVPDAVLVARKTLDALRNGDSDFLLTVVDRSGIFMGIDTPKMSVARFKEDLAAKRGVYCVIFDSSCLGEKWRGNSGSPSSIREILLKQPVRMSLPSKVEGAQKVRAVVVCKDDGSGEVLLTFVFRHAGDNWKLQQIEYW
jgi:hypothetical protein